MTHVEITVIFFRAAICPGSCPAADVTQSPFVSIAIKETISYPNVVKSCHNMLKINTTKNLLPF